MSLLRAGDWFITTILLMTISQGKGGDLNAFFTKKFCKL